MTDDDEPELDEAEPVERREPRDMHFLGKDATDDHIDAFVAAILGDKAKD